MTSAGPAWYWNNIACGEHTGTHFDAPIHWVTGKDYAEQRHAQHSGRALHRPGLRHRRGARGERRIRISC